jgi:hypothetical protein
MLKISKIVGAAGLILALAPVAVFAQTAGKVMPAKAVAEPTVVTTNSGAPVPTLYEQGNGSQLPEANQYYQTQGFGGRGMMGGNFTTSRNVGRYGMMGSARSNSRPSGSMAARAFLALIGGITLILAWSVMFLLSAVLCKKLKMMGGCCKRGQDEKKPEETK